MDKIKLQKVRESIREQLDGCIDFWLKNGIDKKHGGVYTCLDRTGKIYSTDKSVWMQGRCAWTFAWLCNTYGATQEWLDASCHCLDFLEKYCFNKGKLSSKASYMMAQVYLYLTYIIIAVLAILMLMEMMK